jgi:hypothetical protein
MRKEIARVTLFLRASPLQADCESKIAGCTQKIMDTPKLFCGPLRVVCGVRTPHVRLAIWPIFAVEVQILILKNVGERAQDARCPHDFSYPYGKRNGRGGKIDKQIKSAVDERLRRRRGGCALAVLAKCNVRTANASFWEYIFTIFFDLKHGVYAHVGQRTFQGSLITERAWSWMYVLRQFSVFLRVSLGRREAVVSAQSVLGQHALSVTSVWGARL